MGHRKRKIAIPGPCPKLKTAKPEMSVAGQYEEIENQRRKERCEDAKT